VTSAQRRLLLLIAAREPSEWQLATMTLAVFGKCHDPRTLRSLWVKGYIVGGFDFDRIVIKLEGKAALAKELTK